MAEKGSTTYSIEHAKSGRSGCKGPCKQPIEKDALRFGSITTGERNIVSWRHFPRCMTKRVLANALKQGDILDAVTLEGLGADEEGAVKEALTKIAEGVDPATLSIEGGECVVGEGGEAPAKKAKKAAAPKKEAKEQGGEKKAAPKRKKKKEEAEEEDEEEEDEEEEEKPAPKKGKKAAGAAKAKPAAAKPAAAKPAAKGKAKKKPEPEPSEDEEEDVSE